MAHRHWTCGGPLPPSAAPWPWAVLALPVGCTAGPQKGRQADTPWWVGAKLLPGGRLPTSELGTELEGMGR